MIGGKKKKLIFPHNGKTIDHLFEDVQYLQNKQIWQKTIKFLKIVVY